jgi:hypothetical protein
MYIPLSPSLSQSTKAKEHKFRVRFGIRTLFALVFVVACVAGWWHISNLPSESEKAAMLLPRVQQMVEKASQEFPTSVGAWKGRAMEVDPSIRNATEVHFLNWHQYVKGDLQADVSLYFGSPHAVSPGLPPGGWWAFNETLMERVNVPSKEGKEHLFLLHRMSESIQPSNVYYQFWACSTDGDWDAPTNPRAHFSGAPWLFRVSLVLRGEQLNDETARTVGVEFLQTLLLELDQALFAKMRNDSLIQDQLVRP